MQFSQLQKFTNKAVFFVILIINIFMGCSSNYQYREYYKSSTYTHTSDSTYQGAIYFYFSDSTYTCSIQGHFNGGGKWKFSKDRKKLILKGAINMTGLSEDYIREMDYEFDIRKHGKFLTNEQYNLKRNKSLK